MADYLSGSGTYKTSGPGFFKNASSVAAVAGGQLEKLGYGYKVSALRITVTVRQGVSSFSLTAVVAPEGGAKLVPVATPAVTSTNAAQPAATSAPVPTDPNAAKTNDLKSNDLKYPFTFLEIRENDSPPRPPALPAAPTA